MIIILSGTPLVPGATHFKHRPFNFVISFTKYFSNVDSFIYSPCIQNLYLCSDVASILAKLLKIAVRGLPLYPFTP
ncbi:hypothetical protein S122051_1562 [Staphylococcus aureus subsp. aureus 122051]|nr:hypothetical protein S122051_1562 [Staphylococcus aureus subsp. aureus 122051]